MDKKSLWLDPEVLRHALSTEVLALIRLRVFLNDIAHEVPSKEKRLRHLYELLGVLVIELAEVGDEILAELEIPAQSLN